MKRSIRFTLFAGIFAIVEVIEFFVLFAKIHSPYIADLAFVTIMAMIMEAWLIGIFIAAIIDWGAKEDKFFNATGVEAPYSNKDFQSMRAMKDQLIGLFVRVEEAMEELSILKRQRLTASGATRCAELEEQIRNGREEYSKCRELALPFLIDEFVPPTERKLSKAVADSLNQPLARFPR